MRKLPALIAISVPLLLPSASAGGGWATLEVASKPTGIRPGEAWVARMTVRQHGVTLMNGLKPSVAIRHPSSGRKLRYRARPAGEPGVYEARVVFPRAGTWRYAIDNGFGGVHRFAPVAVGHGAPRPAGEPLPRAAAEPRPAEAPPADARGRDAAGAAWLVGTTMLLVGIAAVGVLVRRRVRARRASVV